MTSPAGAPHADRPVLVLDGSPVIGGALVEALAEDGVSATRVDDVDKLVSSLEEYPQALLLLGTGVGVRDDVTGLVELATSRGADCLVLLAEDGAGGTSFPVLPVLEAGALGFVPAEVGATELTRTVRAALRGEACVPRQALTEILRSLIERRRADDDEVRRYHGLSRREREVLHLLAEGNAPDDIAGTLVLSPATVRSHLSNVLVKLGVRSRSDAVSLVHRHGLTRGGL